MMEFQGEHLHIRPEHITGYYIDRQGKRVCIVSDEEYRRLKSVVDRLNIPLPGGEGR